MHLKRTNLRKNILLRHSMIFWLLLHLVQEFLFAAPCILLCTCAFVITEREREKKKRI